MIELGALVAGNVMQGQDGMILPAVLAAGGASLPGRRTVNGTGVTLLRIRPGDERWAWPGRCKACWWC